ncbi:hypothetical protein PPTG_19198 [Phytophthora nicotianae INRA-310]|uniref:Uncharacterized protein n=1 Tax=Phytophthora nicotianae (strain INRA-310) TaxID=761204 RepID=W2PD03_PHYN3|nr:hypothetical protein PPTG_19198 [Phytophthora nicotianae INRA-310]ETM98922.1 hypothetical protein PPTG_19198 [Phytophthora nicotianae INRA-310]
MRTHPVFYVGLLKPCLDPARESVESLAPTRKVAAQQRVAGPRQDAVRQQVASPQQAVEQQVAEQQDENRAAGDAATSPSDPAAERVDTLGQQPDFGPLEAYQTSPPVGTSPRDHPPSGQQKRWRREQIGSVNRRGVSAHEGRWYS